MSDPNYYAIIPATVRYDNDLTNSQKIMFGEITALSQKNGYCYASNNYFANLYDVDPSTVSKWVKGLRDKQYVSVEYDRNGKEIKMRKIRPLMDKGGIEYNQGGIELKSTGVLNKDQGGIEYMSKKNTIKGNTTSKSNTTSFTRELEDSNTKEELLEIWLAYRKKKGKHANLYEQDVLLNKKWKDKSISEVKEAILYTVSNGWITLQWPDKSQTNGQEKPVDKAKRHLEQTKRIFQD